MDLLKKFFPYSFGAKDVTGLVIKIVVYLVVGLIVSLVCKLVSLIPFVGPIVAWLVGSVVDLYVLVGIVLTVLDYLKVLK